jgi:DNA-binding LytR/AlgR family response regulator
MMSKDVLSVLVIEDEPIWSTMLELFLRDFGFELAGIADTFEKAIVALNKKNYDIVLLDISLDSEKSGLEIGKLIHSLYKKPFIFITASYSNHTLQEAVAVAPAGYLSKPISENSLFITIQNAIRNFENHQEAAIPAAEQQDNNTSFYIKQGNSYNKVEWADVVSLSVEQNYTRVLTTHYPAGYLIRSTLQKTLDSIVPEPLRKEFLRINRGEVIRAGYIEELKGQTVVTKVKSFTITESFIKEVKQKLHLVS